MRYLGLEPLLFFVLLQKRTTYLKLLLFIRAAEAPFSVLTYPLSRKSRLTSRRSRRLRMAARIP
jgi:hypothetical protein